MSYNAFDARLQSINGNRYLQVFATKEFVDVYPLKYKSDCHEALYRFVKDYCAPMMTIFDGSVKQGGHYTKFISLLRKYDILKVT